MEHTSGDHAGDSEADQGQPVRLRSVRVKYITLIIVLAFLQTIGCVPQQQYQQEVTQVQQLKYLNTTYMQLNQNLQSEVAANQVQIKQLQNHLEVTIVNSILFPEGGWELNQQGQQEMNKVTPALQGLSGKQIVIAGYTDNLPILAPLSEHFPTNWSLSAGRAISVVRYCEAQGIDSNQLSAVAFGKYHPIAFE
jgi:chemotaxis protein MotB